ncbi:MAG: aldolase/citrate lyase family protein [Actinomycetota bacterium]|nr:aldolase/citrate lyase family protein [Actinomycetota bacterium]
MFLKERLARGDLARGVVSVIPSPVVTQAVAAAGADFVMIDREHGPIDRETVHAMIAATAGTACAPLVRVPAIDEAEVKAALDAGAEGIVFPLVRTAEDAARCVSLMTYPPEGTRGWGPFVAHARHGTSLGTYAHDVTPHLACCLLVETVEAVENLDAILAVPGIDLVVLAQYDLSTALGVHGRFDDPVFLDAAQRIERAVLDRGIPLGGAALTPEATRAAVAKGYRFLFNGFDVTMLAQQVESFADWA